MAFAKIHCSKCGGTFLADEERANCCPYCKTELGVCPSTNSANNELSNEEKITFAEALRQEPKHALTKQEEDRIADILECYKTTCQKNNRLGIREANVTYYMEGPEKYVNSSLEWLVDCAKYANQETLTLYSSELRAYFIEKLTSLGFKPQVTINVLRKNPKNNGKHFDEKLNKKRFNFEYYLAVNIICSWE